MKTFVIAFTALALLAGPAFADAKTHKIAGLTSAIASNTAAQATIVASDPTLSTPKDARQYNSLQRRIDHENTLLAHWVAHP